MNQQKFKNILFYVMIVAVILLSVYFVVWTQSESFKYLQNPFGYPISVLEKENNATMSCTGIIFNAKGSSRFEITNKGISLINYQANFNPLLNLNISNLSISNETN